jgi:hypothetical protein
MAKARHPVAPRATEVRNSSRRIFALYCVFGDCTGRFNPRFQVLALFWILPLFTPTNTFFFEKSADRCTHRALIRRTGCRGGILGVFWPVLGAEKHGKDTTTRTFRKEKTVKIEEKIPKNQKQIK